MTMHKNSAWLCFLAFIFVITFTYTGKTLIQSYHYLQLSSETEASATAWSIHKEADDEFIPLAKYTFQVRDNFYDGETLLIEETTNNPWAAEESLKPLAAKKHHVWYSPKDPAISSLQKKFPLKECIYAGILWAISIYFFWLGVYVAKLQK